MDEDVKKLIAELDAKAWAAMRYKAPSRERKDHVCYRAARLIEKLASDTIPIIEL
jgi:hypothetical protein